MTCQVPTAPYGVGGQPQPVDLRHLTWHFADMADRSTTLARQVFVGHPYRLFDMKDYRRIYRSVGKEFGVTFQFADEKITGTHIMDKITDYIAESDFSIFDISGWNPNVTLELGLAWGLDRPFFLLMNPDHSKGGDAPSDIKGIDRMDWRSFTDLEEQLTKLLAQEYGLKPASSIDDTLANVRKQVVELLKTKPGLRTEEIATALNVATPIVKMIMRSLLEEKLVQTSGQRRGMKYTLVAKRTARAGGRKTSSSKRKTRSKGRPVSRKTRSSKAKTQAKRKSTAKTQTRRRSTTARRATRRRVSRARGSRR